DVFDVLLVGGDGFVEAQGWACTGAVDDDGEGAEVAVLHAEVAGQGTHGDGLGKGAGFGGEARQPVVVAVLEGVGGRRDGYRNGAVEGREQGRLVVHVVEQGDQ